MADSTTDFSNKCFILSELWLTYRDDEEFADFVEYNDIGLPLAYAIDNNLATINKTGEGIIDETFSLLLQGLGVEDTGFDNLDDLLALAEDE